MNIELSAAKAWREAAVRDLSHDDVKMAALEQITDNIIGRLEDGKDVTFSNTVNSIMRCEDPATEEVLLEQVRGIATEQSPDAINWVNAQVRGFRNP